MHDLTRGDIHLYVEDTLGKNARFRQLQKEDPQCPNFVLNIVREADGIFLWVFLVIRSLLDGLTNSDRIGDLQERVNETPKDLKDYFKTILFSTQNRYRTQTARIFTIAINAEIELPLMAYWVIDQENPRYFFQCPAKTPSVEILNSRLENMRRRLKVLSKGLLEASDEDNPLFGFKVVFLHRTVKDYLQTPDAQSMLQSWSDHSFNVDWEICSAAGTLLKIAPRETFDLTHDAAEGTWGNAIHVLLPYAARVDQNPLIRADLASMLEHLQAALTPAFQEYKEVIYQQLKDEGPQAIFKETSLIPDLVIMSACVSFGVFNFVADKFAKEPQLCSRLTNHVYSLIWSMRGNREEGFLEYSAMPMLELLLAHGVDPNSGFDGKTEWGFILEDLMSEGEEMSEGEDVDRRRLKSFEGIKSLLRHGADFELQFTSRTGQVVRLMSY
jgi:hypothetical protein